MDWNWSLGGNSVTSNTSSDSGLSILSQLVNGGNKNNVTTMATGGSGKPNEFNQGSTDSGNHPGGSKLDPINNPPTNQPDIGADIHMGGSGRGGGDVDSDPSVGIGWGRLNQGYNATGFVPNLTGQDQSAYGRGGGGGGGSYSTANGQKLIFNDRNGTWSLYDPTAKKWEDNIATKDIYGRLTGDLKDANPEWYYGQAASSAMDNRLYDLYRQGNQYQQRQMAGANIFRYPSYGL